MESSFSLSTSHTQYYPYSPSKTLFPATGKRHSTTAKPSVRLLCSLKPPPKPNNNESASTSVGPPITTTTTRSKITKTPANKPLQHQLTVTDTPKTKSSSTNAPSKITKTPSNPLKNLRNSPPQPPPPTNSNSLTNKLWLTSKLSPPPPPSPPPPVEDIEPETKTESKTDVQNSDDSEITTPRPEFREEGKIFVGNLPNWIKKHELTEFFRQFGPIKDVVLIKGHDDTERNLGYGFVMYGGPMAERSAMKAVEFDGIEFHGRVLTVKLDDGRRLKERYGKRERWVEGSDGEEHRNKWHEEREGSRNEFRRVLETEPENWQAVVSAFERIPKVVDIAI